MLERVRRECFLWNVGMSKTQVYLDSGRRPSYENVKVIKKHNGKPVFFGY